MKKLSNKSFPKFKIRFGYLSIRRVSKCKKCEFFANFSFIKKYKKFGILKRHHSQILGQSFSKSKYILEMEFIDWSLESFFSGISPLRELCKVCYEKCSLALSTRSNMNIIGIKKGNLIFIIYPQLNLFFIKILTSSLFY